MKPCWMASTGSVVGRPSRSSAQSGGMGAPFLAASRSLPPATTEVAMSSTIGSFLPAGTANENGLVAYVGVVPPKGGRMAGPLFIDTPMKPARAAIIV
jgi:hypothetical protein